MPEVEWPAPGQQHIASTINEVPNISHIESYNQSIRTVVSRAFDAGWRVTLATSPSGNRYILVGETEAAEDRRDIMVLQSQAKRYVDLDFARYRSLRGKWSGFLDKNTNTALLPLTVSSRPALAKLFPGANAEVEAADTAELSSEPTISIGGVRPQVGVNIHLRNKDLGLLTAPIRDGRPALAVTVPPNADDVLIDEQLDKVAMAVCFEIECRIGSPLRVERNRLPVTPIRFSPPADAHGSLHLPRNSYDPDALGLYLEAGWSGQPTNRYLLYYQVLEYYFDQAVQTNAQEAVARTIRDPRFSVGDSQHIREIVRQAQSYSANAGERDQLRLLIAQIVGAQQVVEDFTDAHEVKAIVGARKQVIKGVSAVRLEADNSTLVNDLAGRIYSLRNRIVHAKRTDSFRESPPLWPTSPEARELGADVAIIRYLAQRALIRYAEGGKW